MAILPPGKQPSLGSSGAAAGLPTLEQAAAPSRALSGWAQFQRVIDQELPQELATVEHLVQLTGRILSGL